MAGAVHVAVQYAIAPLAPTRAQVRRWVAAALAGVEGIEAAMLTFRFVDEVEGRTLNRTYRDRDYATNVLTFPLSEPDASTVEADIVVCVPVVEREAAEQHKTFAAHCAHLVVHGTLHACGHDHEDTADAEAMEEVERRVLARFRIDDPYRVQA